MPLRIDLPDDLIHDLEQEAARQRIPLAEIIREALHLWRANRAASATDRERVMQVLRARQLTTVSSKLHCAKVCKLKSPIYIEQFGP
jgi:ribbon-helix-helix CopG family protein